MQSIVPNCETASSPLKQPYDIFYTFSYEFAGFYVPFAHVVWSVSGPLIQTIIITLCGYTLCLSDLSAFETLRRGCRSNTAIPTLVCSVIFYLAYRVCVCGFAAKIYCVFVD